MVNYSFKDFTENMAKAYGSNLGISTKKSVEMCTKLKGKTTEKAKVFLTRVIEMKDALPMRRFIRDTPHRPGVGPGKYPIKVAKAILEVVENAEKNAQNLGLSTSDLVIIHMLAQKASAPWHYGRQKRRKMKRTHIELVVQEKKQQPKESSKKSDHKEEAKKVTKND